MYLVQVVQLDPNSDDSDDGIPRMTRITKITRMTWLQVVELDNNSDDSDNSDDWVTGGGARVPVPHLGPGLLPALPARCALARHAQARDEDRCGGGGFIHSC